MQNIKNNNLSWPSWKDPRLAVISILIVYVVVGISYLGFNRSPSQVLTVVLGACLLDAVLHRFLKGIWILPVSAVITGLSLSILVNYAHGFWLPLIPVFLAIGSKYLVTFEGRHIFNPSLFGIVGGLIISNDMISIAPSYQWGEFASVALFIITTALLLFVFKIKRNYLIVSFLLFYFLGLALRGWITRHHLPPETLYWGTLTSAAFYLFVFFMITDPATSPADSKKQVLMAFIVVVIDLLLHKIQTLSTIYYAAFILFSLKLVYLHGNKLQKLVRNRSLQENKNLTERKYTGLSKKQQVYSWLAVLSVWMGYQIQVSFAQSQYTEFYLHEIDAESAGIAVEMGDVLDQVDTRLQPVAKWLLSVGDSVAVADFDLDGRQDLYLSYPLKKASDRNGLYRNVGGFKFERLEIAALDSIHQTPATDGLPSSGLWLDYDNDGDPDLLISTGYGKSVFLQNRIIEDGKSGFIDISNRMGLSEYTVSVDNNALDFNRDGRLDLIISNSLSPYLPGYQNETRFNPFALVEPEYQGDRRMFNVMHRSWHNANNGGKNLLYKNTSDGFELVQNELSGIDATRWTIDVATGDINNDGWTDLYFANDFGPDELMLNIEGSFKSIAGKYTGQISRDTYKGMNASMADVDNNGTLDIYVSNVHEPLQAEGSLLWINNGKVDTQQAKAFKDKALALNVLNSSRFGWGAAIGDMNLDGRQDILQINGLVDNTQDPLYAGCPDYWYWNEKIALTGPDIHGYADTWADLRGRCIFPYESKRLMLNYSKNFIDVAAQIGWQRKENGRGIALADFDNDGDLDVITSHQFKSASLYKNDLLERNPHKAWLGLELEANGQTCNRDALGSKVKLSYQHAGKVQIQYKEVHASNGFSAQNEKRLLFGFPDDFSQSSVDIEIDWCGFTKVSQHEMTLNKYHKIKQMNL